MTTRYASLVATGRYVPPLEITNAALQDRFRAIAPDFVSKMEERSGIRTRWYAPEDWVTSDLALQASRDALKKVCRNYEITLE